ncbi:hypothetical protein OJ996_05880 [Luteolibacter sp. GHJ8]|uniref:VCBS repeat-containing protein n=1 Tax=Luteolibacter rhizosphaerae TaxID=2989719 RepID=A0ABT3FZT2_9BACT|nr:FG-GAP repeat protein [Luteolibacter rhizosphaerae]MCW1913091.1 hypothetical protein [Luteolibacter rhizosphaerae]
MKSPTLTITRATLLVAAGSMLVAPAMDASLLFTILSGPDNALLGSTLLAAGDWNADDIPDLAVGDPGFSGGAGQVIVVSGDDGSILHTFTGSAGQALGSALALLDANGDGTADLAVGASGGSGSVSIFLRHG